MLAASMRGLVRNVRRALVGGGFQVTVCDLDPRQVRQLLAVPFDLLVVDLDAEPEDVLWLLRWIRRHGLEPRTVLLTRVCRGSLLGSVLDTFAFSNVVAKHNPEHASRDIIDETELMVTCHKLLSGEIFGIERYVIGEAVNLNQLEIRGNEDKTAALVALDAFLDELDCHRAIRPAVTLVADELLMNAIYNAPRDEQMQAKYGAKDRRLPHRVGDAEMATMKYACDGKNICLSVSDAFGALERSVVMRYLKRCFSEEPGIMEDKAGGAGLGLFMVFSSTTQLVFNVRPGEQSEVIALFYARQGAKALRCSGRSLNFFVAR